jgi:hypothetical protein
MKIFLASSPKSSHNNLHDFYLKLSQNPGVEILHPTGMDELPKDFGGVIEHEIAKLDMLKILSADLVIFDYDARPPIEWLIYGNVNPQSETIVVSRAQTDIDPNIGRKVRAVLKAQDVYEFICYLLSLKFPEISSDKSDPSLSEESSPNP